MKKTTKLKAFALSLAMALGVLLPNASFGQSEDFFRESDNYGGNRDFATTWALFDQSFGSSSGGYSNQSFGSSSGGFSNQSFGQNGSGITNQNFGAPLGSGLLIMITTGAGYALLKKKNQQLN